MDRGVSAAWGAMVAIITVRDLSKRKRPPLPSELLASFVVFGLLGLLAGPAPAPARLTGWGLVLAVLLADSVNILEPVGAFMSGEFGAQHGGEVVYKNVPPTGGTDPFGPGGIFDIFNPVPPAPGGGGGGAPHYQ